MFWQRVRELPWWAISLSLGVNIVSLGAAVICISVFRERIPLIVVGFLFAHIFISQPLKDWIIARMGIGARYSGQTTFLSFENRTQRIMHVRDILDFLSWLIRAWKLTRVRVVVFDEEDFVYFLSQGKRARKMKLKDEITEEFRSELAQHPGGRAVSALSAPLKAYMQARKVKFIVPLLFRERLIGLLGFNELIDKARQPYVDHAAHRISLAIENDQLERTVPRSEFLKKEFRLAERIERHLSGVSTYRAGNYTVQKLDTAWEKKHFAAIFGCAEGDGVFFVMLLRLSRASTRSNALQLFSTQGYFYALCRYQNDINALGRSLHQSLVTNENQPVLLEGFLVALYPGGPRVGILAFGSHLAYRGQSGWTWVKESAPLGAENFDAGAGFELPAQKELILSMREYPLLLISGGQEVPGPTRDRMSLGASGGGQEVQGPTRDRMSAL